MEHNQNDFARSAPGEEGHVTAARPEPPLGPPAAVGDALAINSPPLPRPPNARLDFEPIELEHRSDGWTREKQRAFIEALADCGIVREAAARVGMSEQSARRLRRRADAATFNIAWEAALQLGADRLRSVAFERAIEGVVKPHFYHGEKVGEERVYDNRLLLALLARVERTVPYADAKRALSDWERWMAAIEDGDAPPPAGSEGGEPRLWQDVEGRWWTDFRPPSGFAGEHRGDYGDEDYCRVCIAGELAAIEAMQARKAAEEHIRRDAFFARIISPG
ncbi:MAG: hypothetical protein QOH81_2019 [Sphingomonadales bacterium]|jgi:hypothetical protein|nr:hypothetical protein [Sphingomonadales bacterium]